MPKSVTFEHYEVMTREDGSLHELGRGAMGITYKGFDTMLCVPVALKVINAAHLHSERARQRFLREARSAALLRHRNVASIYHLGEEGGNYFYVMEFIDGETVEALVRREGTLAPPFALRIAAQVARALNAADEQGLVHRDIKPANLMAVMEDDDLVIKVIDFGLAKVLLADGEASSASITRGGFVGTPHFASPEQLAEREIDTRSDIYSLGATLWFLLRGTPPFQGSVARVVGQQLSKPPPFDELAAFPSGVVELLRRMLAKDPAARPQSPAELRKEIEDCLKSLDAGIHAPSVHPASSEPASAPSSATDAVEVRFEAGATIGGRHLITHELGESEAGTSFRAHDLDRDCDVCLLSLHRELMEDREHFAQIQGEADALTALAHENVLRVLSFTNVARDAFLTLEWTNGFTLRQLLRTRRELSPAEVWRLLGQVATGLDYAVAHLPRLDLGLHHVSIDFPAAGDSTDDLLSQPVDAWPPHVVKINPLATWRDIFASTWATGQTLVGGLATHESKTHGGRGGAMQALGALVYESLGGVASGYSTRNYTPLAALDEESNAVLRRLLVDPESFDSATHLIQQLAAPPVQEVGSTVHLPRRAESPAGAPIAEIAPGAMQEPPARTPDEGHAVHSPLRRFALPALALAVITAGSYFLFRPRSGDLLLTTATPTPSPIVRLSTPGPVTPAPSTRPTPPPAPSRRELAGTARRTAESFEAKEQSKEALSAWLRMAREYPEFDAGRLGAELLLERLRRRTGGLSPTEFAAMKPDILEAAKLGVLAAMMTLGEKLRETDPSQSFAWFCTAAQGGDQAAMMQAGLMLTNAKGAPRDMKKAIAYFRAAAEKGEISAMTALGECYLDGNGIAANSGQAVAFFQKAADKGGVRAMNRLGVCYHKGLGVPINDRESFRYFSEAVKRGSVESIANLGVLYMNGQGVEKNAVKAVEKFREGSLKGDRIAMYFYAGCLEEGLGVKSDAPSARAWYQRSAAAGHDEAIKWCHDNYVPY